MCSFVADFNIYNDFIDLKFVEIFEEKISKCISLNALKHPHNYIKYITKNFSKFFWISVYI